jgi:predicted transposase/invertase (TIGR01784 family)
LKTDSIFFQIFKTDPGILFELLGRSPDLAQDYEFSSVEIKQLAFRIDGVFLPKPDSNDQTVWFVEVQFGRDPKFYGRFFGEIYFYLDLHQNSPRNPVASAQGGIGGESVGLNAPKPSKVFATM